MSRFGTFFGNTNLVVTILRKKTLYYLFPPHIYTYFRTKHIKLYSYDLNQYITSIYIDKQHGNQKTKINHHLLRSASKRTLWMCTSGISYGFQHGTSFCTGIIQYTCSSELQMHTPTPNRFFFARNRGYPRFRTWMMDSHKAIVGRVFDTDMYS